MVCVICCGLFCIFEGNAQNKPPGAYIRRGLYAQGLILYTQGLGSETKLA